MKQTEKVKYSPSLIENMSVQANDLKASTKLLKRLMYGSALSSILATLLIILTRETEKLPNWRILIIVMLIISLVSFLYSLPTYLFKNHMLVEIMKAKRSLNH